MAQLKLEHKFDSSKKRHYLNNILTVMHCHHYATLFTQLALDARELVDGTQILRESAEDVFFGVLSDYYSNNGISDSKERMDIAAQLFLAMGMGRMDILSGDESGGEVAMPFSYVDDGWLKKWGQNKEPVNFIGAGYLSAMFAAVYGKPVRTYKTIETQSRVMGAEKSKFKVTL
jgi:predicted hydrocarbon binding protein